MLKFGPDYANFYKCAFLGNICESLARSAANSRGVVKDPESLQASQASLAPQGPQMGSDDPYLS